MCGAKVVLVDVDPNTLNIDPAMVAAAITPKTKAIIPVHVTGRPANMAAIMEIATLNNIPVIEDAAEALMSCCEGKLLGTWGILGCFSFSPNKMITTGQGGLIVTNEDKLYTQLRQLKDQGRAIRGTGGDDLHPVIGFNFKFTNLQAAVGLGQLKQLPIRLKRVAEIYCLYRDNLSNLKEITILPFNLKSGERPQWIDALVDHRDSLDAWLAQNDIHCRRFWHPLHSQKPYLMSDEHFTNSTSLSKRAIWLPSAFTLEDNDIGDVCKKIQEFFKKKQK
jgi:perosamine synthetase